MFIKLPTIYANEYGDGWYIAIGYQAPWKCWHFPFPVGKRIALFLHTYKPKKKAGVKNG